MSEYLTPNGFELKALVCHGQVISAELLSDEQIATALPELFGTAARDGQDIWLPDGSANAQHEPYTEGRVVTADRDGERHYVM